MNNILLKKHNLPPFKQIKLDDIEPALDKVLASNRRKLKKLLAQKKVTWENLMRPIEDMSDRLDQMWSPISHLNHVKNSPKLRKIYNACLSKLSIYITEMSHNVELYRAVKSLKQSSGYKKFNAEQKRVIQNELRDFKLSGVALSGKKKKQFAELAQKLSQFSAKFSENLLDATHAWTYHVKTKKQLKGLPEHVIAAAKQLAEAKKETGWCLSLDMPVYLAVLSYADDEKLRKVMYEAFVTRASDQGPNAGKFDNTSIMVEILALRKAMAELVGYRNYADYSLVTKMAKTSKEVTDFLYQLAKRSKAKGKKERDMIKRFAKKLGHDTLNPWDVMYYSEKLTQAKFNISQEMLRPYFQEKKVLQGLFHLVEKLFSISIKEKKGVEVWHKDVKFFEIYDQNKKLRGGFYTDLYARPKKNSGAWMDECRGRRRLSEKKVQLPIAYLICNFSHPMKGRPSLLTHDEIITLFHEFGHCLQHLLTKVDYPEISGINGVEWDAVELSSQFMENFCWQKEIIDSLSEHFETKGKLPDEMFKNLVESRNFYSGMQMLRQLEFGLFDFLLHEAKPPKTGPVIQKILNHVRKEVAVAKTPSYNRFQNSFAHIFAGGYAAGYYSYKWAEVLSADAFAKFEEHGVLNPRIGRSFAHCILETGGSRPAMQLFKKFRGRAPKIDALLRHSGIE